MSGAAKSPDQQTVSGLMKRMGSKSGYDPLPPTQHKWQACRWNPPLNRMWSWMVRNTVGWGHRCEYAVNKEHQELHLEHLAQDLEMDISNARKVWDAGVEMGLWRNGDKAEGKRKLYLSGEVPLEGIEQAGEENKKKGLYKPFPDYVLKKISKLPEDKQRLFWKEYDRDEALRKRAIAEVVAGVRNMFVEREDSRFDRYGVKKRREELGAKQGTAAQVEERKRRLNALRPTLELIVDELVPEVEAKLENGAKKRVPTPAAPADAPDAPLVSKPRGRADSQRKALGSLPELSGMQRDAEAMLFEQIERMQTAYPHTDFSDEKIDRAKSGDRVTVRLILETVGAENVPAFLVQCAMKFRGVGEGNALGKKPARAPGSTHGPRSLGLIVYWARDYAKKLAEGARPAPIDERRREEEIRACQAFLKNPNEAPEVHEMARQLLKFHGYKGE